MRISWPKARCSSFFYWVWPVFDIRDPFQHLSLQRVTSTQGPLLLSRRNLSLIHVTSKQIRQFNTSLKQKLANLTQIRHLWSWRVKMQISVEAPCRSGGILLKWRITPDFGVWKWVAPAFKWRVEMTCESDGRVEVTISQYKT